MGSVEAVQSKTFERDWLKTLKEYTVTRGYNTYVYPEESRSGMGYTSFSPLFGRISPCLFPILTTHASSPRLGWEEMLMFLRGETDTTVLEKKGINFWKGNTSRKFLDSRGLDYLPVGDLGAAYSMQWRKCGDYTTMGDYHVDQLYELINGLITNPFGRRHVVSLWNPTELDGMPLTPCWWSSVWVVHKSLEGDMVLDVHLDNRSLDVLFGMNFAVSQYRILQMALCSMLDMKLGSLYYKSVNPHVYDNQWNYLEEMCKREPSRDNVATLSVHTKKPKNTIEAIDILTNLEWGENVTLRGYQYNKAPFVNKRPEMVA